MAERRPRGRRPKRAGDTRATILAVALRHFANDGFDATTSVSIAHEAGVDPALVLYYFDSKESLFFEAVRERLYPELVTAFARPEPLSRIGETIVDTFLRLWDAEEQANALAALVRAGISNERIGGLFREFIREEILPQVARRVGKEPRDLRVGLVASQLIGLGLMRYVLRLEPVVRASREELVAAIGPTLTRYVTGALGAPSSAGRRRPPSRSAARRAGS